MNTGPYQKFLLMAVVVTGIGRPETCRAGDLYHLLKTIPIGGDSSCDCLSVDPEARRLYVTHAAEIVVVDLSKDEVLGRITNTPEVCDFTIAPDLQRGYASNGRGNSVSIVDLPTLQTVMTVNTGENPGSLVFEPKMQEIYVLNGQGQSFTVFNADSGRISSTTELPGKPEFGTADPKAGRVYENIGDENVVVAVDIKTHQVTSLWAVSPGERPTAMALDAKHHHLFVPCQNNLMPVLDTKDGNVLATIPIGARVDAAAFDPATDLAFASGSDGTVTIVKENGNKLTAVQTLRTAAGAHPLALDPVSHNIYVATADTDNSTSSNGDSPGQPKFVPGTFKILVYGPAQLALK